MIRGRHSRILRVAAAFVTACGASETGQPTTDPITLRVSGSPHLFIAPLLIAEAEGYFAEQDLRVQIIVVPGSTSEAVPALVAGTLDVITGRLSIGVFNAMAQGAPIRLVASQGRLIPGGCVTDGLVVRRSLVENGGLPELADLEGRRIAVNRMNQDGYYVETLLGSAGLTLDDIEAVTLPNAALIEALNRGSIDLAAAPEPWVTHLLEAGHVLYAAAHDVRPGQQTRAIVFGPSLLERNPEAGRRFLVAYLKGLRRYNEGKTARNLDILTEETGVDRGLLQRSCWPTISTDARIDVQSLVDFQSWAVGKELLARPVPEDQLWESGLLEEASRELEPASTPAADR